MHQKPEHVRHRFSLGVSAVVTLFIFVVWVSVRIPGITGQLASERPNDENSSPSVTQNMAATFAGFQGIFTGFTQKVSEVTQEAIEEYQSKTVQTYTASSTILVE